MGDLCSCEWGGGGGRGGGWGWGWGWGWEYLHKRHAQMKGSFAGIPGQSLRIGRTAHPSPPEGNTIMGHRKTVGACRVALNCLLASWLRPFARLCLCGMLGLSLTSCSGPGDGAAGTGSLSSVEVDARTVALADAADPLMHTWGSAEFRAFLLLLPSSELQTLRVALGLASPRDPVPSHLDVAYCVDEIIRSARKATSWPAFRHAGDGLPYDQCVREAAERAGVPTEVIEGGSTFAVEAALTRKALEEHWDSLTQKERAELLSAMAESGSPSAGVLTRSSSAAEFATRALGNWTPSDAATVVVGGPAIALVIHWVRDRDQQRFEAMVLGVHSLRAQAWRAAGRKLPCE